MRISGLCRPRDGVTAESARALAGEEILEAGGLPGLRRWNDAVLDVGDDEVLEQGLAWLFDGVMASQEKARRGERS